MILRGVKEAAGINQIVTIAKIVPLVLFVAVVLFAFKRRRVQRELLGRRRAQRQEPVRAGHGPPCW